MILLLDTSSPVCRLSLVDNGRRTDDEWQADRQLADGLLAYIESRLADADASWEDLTGIGVFKGPGSFTGLRVGIAAAHGLAIGWSIPLSGMNSLALLAAAAPAGEGKVTAAMTGGHGELFVQTFDRKKLTPTGPIASLTPEEAARKVDAPLVVGSGAEALVAARGSGEALPLLPLASRALRLPELLRALECKPIYIRAPDAKPKVAA